MVPLQMHKKVQYLLQHFKNDEWSGPAWYKITKTNDDGFPLEVKLVYFKPLHLGTGSETEVDGELLGSELPGIYKEHPSLKDCYLGLIHSHHTMGAFFSGTDKTTALEHATKDGLFFSTIVASEKTKYVSGFAYADKFGFHKLIEGNVVAMTPATKENKLWDAEIKFIEDEKAKEVQTKYYGNSYYGNSYYGGYSKQTGFNYATTNKKTTKKIQSKYSKPEYQIMDDLLDSYEMGTITYDQLITKAKKECPNINPHWYLGGWD